MGVQVANRVGQKSFGPWGPHTASLDWCEDNYTHFDYIAETYNTFSNIPFMVLGIHGFLSTRNLPHPSRYALAHLCILAIGLGSFIFHGTLLWHAQVMLDELPMIWSGCLLLYIVLVSEDGRGSLALKVLAGIVPFTISVIYLQYPDPVFHQVSYGLIQVATLTQTWRLFQILPRSTPRQARLDQECKWIMLSGALVFLLGFIIWNVDNLFCDVLTELRKHQGELFGALTQGHAWWHLLTGLGASRVLVATTYLSLAIHEPDAFEFKYVWGFHPYVVRKVPPAAQKQRLPEKASK